ncbi:MAG: hypothetical protein WAU07_02965 [Microgenomates group bacterium]
MLPKIQPKQSSFLENSSQSGQVAVVVLLIMVVLLTIGLSIATRTTQEVFLSQQQAESSRVFNAAETGVEDALSQDFEALTGSVTNVTTIDGVDVNYTISASDTLETRLTEGLSAMVDLNQSVSGNLTVRWARETPCNDKASLIFSIYYMTGGRNRVRHVAVGPNSGCRSDGFTNGNPINVDGYTMGYNLPVTVNDRFVRIKAVYNDTHVSVSGNNLPDQFYNVRSEASNEQGDEQRTIQVTRTLSVAPSIMDYAVYSGASLLK